MATQPDPTVVVPEGCQWRDDIPFKDQPPVWGAPGYVPPDGWPVAPQSSDPVPYNFD